MWCHVLPRLNRALWVSCGPQFRNLEHRTSLVNRRIYPLQHRGGLEDEPSVCPLWEDRLPDGESQLPGQDAICSSNEEGSQKGGGHVKRRITEAHGSQHTLTHQTQCGYERTNANTNRVLTEVIFQLKRSIVPTVAMNQSGISQSVVMQEVTTDTLRSLIETFFQKLTQVQWSLLKAGDPDDSTKFLLAELLLAVVLAVTNTVLASLKDTRVTISNKEVQTKLGDILAENFCEALGIRNKVRCVNSERLTTLVVKEVTKSIRSTLSSRGSVDSEMYQHVTPPTKLNKMITCASKMLKKLTAKMQKVFCSRSEALEKEPPQDQSVVKKAKSIEEVIQTAVNNITEPLLHDVLDSRTVSELQAETKSECSTLAMDIAKSITDEVQSLGSNDTQKSLKGAGHKIRVLIENCLTQVSLHRLVNQLMNKYHHKSECERVDSVQSLTTKINNLLEPEDEDKQQELCIFPRYKTLTGNNVMLVTEDLTEKKIRCFVALIKWWQETQAASHSKKLSLAIHNIESVAQGSVEEPTAKVGNVYILFNAAAASTCEVTSLPTSEEVPDETEKKKTLIMSLVKTLVTRLYDSVDLDIKTNKSEVIIQHLFRKLWFKVNRAEFSVTPETMKSLDKAIYKALIKKFDSAANVLFQLNLDEPAIDKVIATCLHTHLMPNKQNAISRFFSSLGKALSKPSRRSSNDII
ncbi:hypothetical protein PAMA_008276 [Pampus argenteus]